MKIYPKPQETGGRLIRNVIGFLRDQNVELPITSHILIAVSGGPDSVALAHLLVQYGRRVVDRKQISFLHVNHSWREDSGKDARFVKELARHLKVPLHVRTFQGPKLNPAYIGRSWEDVAREARKGYFEEVARKKGASVLTAHQADDFAETLLWRLFSGASSSHGGGITARHGAEIRPLLRIRKSELLQYLNEEGQGFRVDPTNGEGRFLRSRLRAEVLPAVERLFPKAVEHLVKLGLDAQQKQVRPKTEETAAEILFGAAGIKSRRAHWEAVRKGQQAVDLPKGWKLTHHSPTQPKKPTGSTKRAASPQLVRGVRHVCHERWTLERFFEPVSQRNTRGKKLD